jgi:hypothetical protein
MAGKLRLVIGVFEQPLALIKAVDELLSQDFTQSDLCVCGNRDSLSMADDLLSTQAHPDPHTVNLFFNTQAYPATQSTVCIVGSTGRLWSTWREVVEPTKQTRSQLEDDGCIATWSQLIEKINNGCLILMVLTSQKNQLSRAATTLLQLSANNVQTLECRTHGLDTFISRGD